MESECLRDRYFKSKIRLSVSFVLISVFSFGVWFLVYLFDKQGGSDSIAPKIMLAFVYLLVVNLILWGIYFWLASKLPRRLTSEYIEFEKERSRSPYRVRFEDVVRVEYPSMPPQFIKLITDTDELRIHRHSLRKEPELMKFLAGVLPLDTELSEPSGPTVYGTRFREIFQQERVRRKA